jgi:hypothetical protein
VADPPDQVCWHRTSETANTFTALGTLVDLATQTYAVPPATIDSILCSIATLLTGSPSRGVAVRAVALLKGLVASTRLTTGPATRVHTRAIDGVIASRAGTLSLREKRASWNAQVTLSAECVTEQQWWADDLPCIGSRPIGDAPVGRPFDSTIESDASDTGVGAVTYMKVTSMAPALPHPHSWPPCLSLPPL